MFCRHPRPTPPSSPAGMSPATPDDILIPPLAGITIAIPAKTSQPVILAGRNESGYARRHIYPAAGGNYHRHPCKNLPTRHPRRQAGIQLWTCRHAKRDTTAAKAAICFCRHPRPTPSSSPAGMSPATPDDIFNSRRWRVVRRSRMDKPNNGETTNSRHSRRSCSSFPPKAGMMNN